MTAVGLRLSVDIDAPVAATWDAVVDWDRQGEWMLGTRVRGTERDGHGVGGGIEAFTGVGPVGFLDTMVVTAWEPPYRCSVRHTGRVVRGTGDFEVHALPENRSRFVWSERLDLPLGVVGRAGWLLLRPAFAAGVQLSLRRLARLVARQSTRP